MIRFCCEVPDCSWQRRAAEERHAPNTAEYRRQQAEAWEAEKAEAQLNKVLIDLVLGHRCHLLREVLDSYVVNALPTGKVVILGCSSTSYPRGGLESSRTVWAQARFERIRQRTKQARAVRQAAVMRGAWQVLPICFRPCPTIPPLRFTIPLSSSS